MQDLKDYRNLREIINKLFTRVINSFASQFETNAITL